MLDKTLLTALFLFMVSVIVVNLSPDGEEFFWYSGITALIGVMAGLTAIICVIIKIWR